MDCCCCSSQLFQSNLLFENSKSLWTETLWQYVENKTSKFKLLLSVVVVGVVVDIKTKYQNFHLSENYIWMTYA